MGTSLLRLGHHYRQGRNAFLPYILLRRSADYNFTATQLILQIQTHGWKSEEWDAEQGATGGYDLALPRDRDGVAVAHGAQGYLEVGKGS